MNVSRQPVLREEGFIRRLLAGTLALGHMAAAEPADVVASLLVGDPEASDAVDEQCLELLTEYRQTLLKREPGVFDVELMRFVSLVAIVRRVQPRRTIGALHGEFLAWNRFFSNFVFDRGLDLRREYWRILALTQELGAEVARLAPRRLMPMWLTICASSGDRGDYPEYYLDIGFLGLRKLPLSDDVASNEDFVLHGLARWAAWQRPNKSRFLDEWHLIEGDFPRSDAYWRDHVEVAISAVENEVRERTDGGWLTFVAADWWRKSLKGKPNASKGGKKSIFAAEPDPGMRLLKALLADIGKPLEVIATRLDHVVKCYIDHAEYTGDVFYLVRTACNVGKQLLKEGPKSELPMRAERALALAEMALAHEPASIFPWVLRRDAFTEMGRTRDAVRVGWEIIRLFPENIRTRNQLSVLLSSLGHLEEAEILLRETIALFPADVSAMCQLAGFMADLGSDRDGAFRLLERALEVEPDNLIARDYFTRLENGQRLVQYRRVLSSIGDEHGDGLIDIPAAKARHVLFRFENGLDTKEEALSHLASLPDDPYVLFVTSRIGGFGYETTFAVSFDRYVRGQSIEDLKILAEESRHVEQVLVNGALAVLTERAVEVIPANDNLPGMLTRLRGLFELFNSLYPPSKADKLRLLSDMSASMLSSTLVA